MEEADRRAGMPMEGMTRQDRERNQAAASGLVQTNGEAGHCPAEAAGGLAALAHGTSRLDVRWRQLALLYLKSSMLRASAGEEVGTLFAFSEV